MRVIAGTARRLPLKTIAGEGTRPTTDRIKETLFNILQGELYDIRFLDLFSGSGGIGIEALSRGAREAVFVEKNRKAVECIRQNLEFTKLSHKAKILPMDVIRGLELLSDAEPFDIIYMDPPYYEGWERQVLEKLLETSLVDHSTWIIIEAAKETSFTFLEELGCVLRKRKDYKINAHLFIQRAGGEKDEKSCLSRKL